MLKAEEFLKVNSFVPDKCWLDLTEADLKVPVEERCAHQSAMIKLRNEYIIEFGFAVPLSQGSLHC